MKNGGNMGVTQRKRERESTETRESEQMQKQGWRLHLLCRKGNKKKEGRPSTASFFVSPFEFVRLQRHAHYQTGNTALSLVWKDQVCSQYFIDTDSKGVVPPLQQVVLELLEDGSVATSDDPPVVLGKLDVEAVQKNNLHHGNLLRFAIGDGGLDVIDGNIKKADSHFVGKANRVRAFADTSSKILFQYMARRSSLRIDDLVASSTLPHDNDHSLEDNEMVSS